MNPLFVFPESLLLAVAVLLPAAFIAWLLREALRRERASRLESVRGIEDAAVDPTFRISAYGIIVAFNQAAERAFGYTAREIIGQHISILLPAASGRPSTIGWNVMHGARQTPNGIGLEVTGKRKDASLIPLDLRMTEVAEGPERVFVAVARDLTGRAEAEQQAGEDQYMSGLLESVATPILILNQEGKIVRHNPAFENLVGYSRAVITGRYFWELLLPNSEWTKGKVAVAQVASGNGVDKGDYTWKCHDGTTVNVHSAMTTMQTSNTRPEYAVVAAHEVIAGAGAPSQHSSLEAVERLAGGVAQKFNELLTSVQGYSELLLHGMDETDPRRRDLEEIKKASDRAAALTSQLLVFSRKQPMRTTEFNITELIGQMKPMLSMLLGDRIQLSTMLDLNLGLLRADAGWVEQIILNLVVNARDAMPHGGKLTLETSSTALDSAGACRIAQLPEGEYIVISVSDSGAGMDAATREHIFEPFYTTKRDSRASGLGMSTVYGVVKQAGGNVTVQSVSGSGTTVKIYLPRFVEAEHPEKAKGLFLVHGASAGD